MNLTHNMKRKLIAQAMGIDSWQIDDTDDENVYYTRENEGSFMRSYSIDGTKVTLGEPQKCIESKEYVPVAEFTLDSATAEFSGDEVLRTGKVFECGDYPDKGFTLTEQEADAAIAAFTPVPNDLEHKPTILDGALGQLRSVSRKGKDIFGTVAIPKWLNDTLGNSPLKVSLAFNKATKQIVGNALTIDPRVKDAQLVAAFTAANNPIPKGRTIMKVKEALDQIKAYFSKAGIPEELKSIDLDKVDFTAEAETPATETSDAAQFADDLKQRDERIAKLEDQLTRKNAAEFADGIIKVGKAFPAERDSIIAMFVQATKDDSAGIACFSADNQPSTRVDELKKMFDARPAHGLTAEEITNAGSDVKFTVLAGSGVPSDDAAKPTSAGQKISTERFERLAEFSGIKMEDK